MAKILKDIEPNQEFLNHQEDDVWGDMENVYNFKKSKILHLQKGIRVPSCPLLIKKTTTNNTHSLNCFCSLIIKIQEGIDNLQKKKKILLA